jgi:hypothetical protein
MIIWVFSISLVLVLLVRVLNFEVVLDYGFLLFVLFFILYIFCSC